MSVDSHRRGGAADPRVVATFQRFHGHRRLFALWLHLQFLAHDGVTPYAITGYIQRCFRSELTEVRGFVTAAEPLLDMLALIDRATQYVGCSPRTLLHDDQSEDVVCPSSPPATGSGGAPGPACGTTAFPSTAHRWVALHANTVCVTQGPADVLARQQARVDDPARQAAAMREVLVTAGTGPAS